MTQPLPAVLNEVITAELNHIHEHRHPARKRNEVARSLIGLALSGGGIRSATTNLGILQALSQMKILPMVDYLSTVSGGGYIGAALSSLLSWNGKSSICDPDSCENFTFEAGESPQFTTRWPDFPFREEFDAHALHRPLGAELVAHLRTHGNFLIARWGVFRRETMRSIGNLVTGIGFSVLVSTLTLFAASALYLSLILLAVPNIHDILADRVERPGWPPPLTQAMRDSASSVVQERDSSCTDGGGECVQKTSITLTPPTLLSRIKRNAQLLGGVVIGSWRTAPQESRAWGGVPPPMWPLVAAALEGAGLILLLFIIGYLLWRHYFKGRTIPNVTPARGESAEDKLERRLLTGVALLLAAIVVVSSIRWHSEFHKADETGQLAALLLPFAVMTGAGLMGAFIGVVWLPHRSAWTRRMRSVWGGVEAITMYGAGIFLLLGLLPLVVYAVRDNTRAVGFGALGSLLVSRLLTSRTGEGERRFALPPALHHALLGLAVTLVLLLGLLYFAGLIARWNDASWDAVARAYLAPPGVVLFILALAVNLNRNSPHYFYSDRLAETYLRSELPDVNRRQRLYRDAMEMRLCCLHGEPKPSSGHRWCNTAPYHLINAAINLAGSRDLTRKDRKSGYWLFSKLYCGSVHTGFRRTSEYRAGKTRLAGAVATSGAAASSAMGRDTFFAQAFATVLFNVRLGNWIENPMYDESLRRTEGTLDPRRPLLVRFFWPRYLWREITMSTVETTTLVNLSDGGHTGDNVGIYPLLQRRCKIIIACDAECDKNLTFGSFTEALRQAYVDMGINVDIDLSLVRPEKGGERSRGHSAVGRIRYPDRPDQESFLIYLKNSLTGDEPEPVLNYWSDRPEFPHESTADQFFNDAQFESYRALGVHIAEHTFDQWAGSNWFGVVQRCHDPTPCQEPAQ